MEVYARVDKTGSRILCGKTDCGAALAVVTSNQSPFQDQEWRYAALENGWKKTESGRYTLSQHALKQLDADRRRASNGDSRDPRTRQARERIASGRAIRDRRGLYRPIGDDEIFSRQEVLRRTHVLLLPAEVQCYDCQSVNILDADRLSLRASYEADCGPDAAWRNDGSDSTDEIDATAH